MPDVYANTAAVDAAILETISDALETRAAEPAQRAMLDSYLAEIPFPPGARVLEIGCGTGAISRVLAMRPGIAEAIGIDPTPAFLDRAQQLSEGIRFLSFVEGDGRCLPFPDRSFDVVVIHTVLCHVPGPEAVLAEAFRVMWPGGWLAVFDGDYATTSVAIGDHDPLQACAAAAIANLVHDPWLVRRLTSLGTAAGFKVRSFRSHGYAQTSEPTYLLTLVDRGADFLEASDAIGGGLCEALKGEARRRVAASQFYGQIAYASMIAQRPA